MGFRIAVFGSSFCIIISFLITSYNYDVKKLIMMQKLQLRTAGLKPTEIGHADEFHIYRNMYLGFK